MSKESTELVANNLEKYKSIFQKIGKFVEAFSKDDISKREYFRMALKAAFIKSYELCIAAVEGNLDQNFFVISGLRGICEDCIALKFLGKIYPNDKDEIVNLKIEEEVLKSSLVQWNFFKEHHPQQYLYYQEYFKEELNEIQTRLKNLMKIHIKQEDKRVTMPTVSYMAKKTQQKVLYDYFYHASSSYVHFNARMLFRMGWGPLPEINFSTSNFTDYYRDFGRFYSMYLFKEMAKLLNENNLALEIKSEVEALENLLNHEQRWPELVTFEEMNIPMLEKLFCFQSPEESPS